MTTNEIAPREAIAELASIRLDEDDLDAVLLKVAQLAQRSLHGASDVSVTLIRDGQAFTAAYTSDRALRLDESQYQGEHGPCMDVAQSTGKMLVRDMSSEQRWAAFCTAAMAAGVASSLSLSLPIQEALVGALNIYGEQADAFSEADVELGVTFAAHAAVAVANAHLYDAASTLAENMKLAMESRAAIEQAKGIIMAREKVDAETAFAMLSAISQRTNLKLRDIALELIAKVTKPSD